MECNWNSDLLWLPEGEQDFPLGAKATSSLLSATDLDINYDISDLPDWMESRNTLFDPPDYGLFNNDGLPEQMECDQVYNEGIDTEDYGQAIKPEDMLVPLSELQPEKYAPQGIVAQTLSAVPTIPKVTIRVNKVKVIMPKHTNIGYSEVQFPPEVNSIQSQQSSITQSRVTIQPSGSNQNAIPTQSIETLPNYNADELLNELVDLANKEPNGLTGLISSFDSSVVQAGMDDLLTQLETDESKEVSHVPELPIEPQSPDCTPSPVPSVGSLSPQSTVDSSFHQFSPVFIQEDIPVSQESDNEISFASLLSPTSDDSLSVSSPVVADDEDSSSDYSKTIHSYSLSPRKSKANRKNQSRPGAYPEGRRERKKEQNKQAALRYRHKKKQEDDVLMTEIHAEEERQKKLKAKYTNLKQELTYLKKIMREVLIAKGTLSPDAFKKK